MPSSEVMSSNVARHSKPSGGWPCCTPDGGSAGGSASSSIGADGGVKNGREPEVSEWPRAGGARSGPLGRGGRAGSG